MKKYKLKDLVDNGSSARRNVDSDLLVGDISQGYGYGDILDANATTQIVEEKINELAGGLINENVGEEIEKLHTKDNEYEQRISSLESTSQYSNAQVVGDVLIIGSTIS